jgi:hypothetical protein
VLTDEANNHNAQFFNRAKKNNNKMAEVRTWLVRAAVYLGLGNIVR